MSDNARLGNPEGFASMPKAPPASSFPENPASWYLFCHVDQLRKGPLPRRVLGRNLVAFRTEGGKVGVLDARCSHLGANLGCGEVVGETIRCPFHHWQFGRDGRCEKIPAGTNIPPFARQQSYPVAELCGFIFFFNGAEALFPFPFFAGETPGDFVASRMFSYQADASWFMVAAQGFDTQHFETVHDRRLLRPPEVDCPNPFLRCNRYFAEIIGESMRDRVLCLLAGKTVDLTINNWGGTLFIVKAKFPRACNRFIVSYRPLEDGRTHFDVIVFAHRGLAAMSLAMRRGMTRAHLVSEADQVRNTEYRPARFIPPDADMIDCFRWLAALPQSKPAAKSENLVVNSMPTGKDCIESIH